MLTIGEKYKREIDEIDIVSNPRVKAISERYFNKDRHICPERSHLATESWKMTEGQPLHIRRAKIFEKICDEIPIAIFDHELIAGSQTSFLRGVGLQLDFSSRVGIEKEEGDRRLRGVNVKCCV